MELGVRQGCRPHTRDDVIVRALYSVRDVPARGPELLALFRNEEGELYRLATLAGKAQEVELRRRLNALGLRQPANGEPLLSVMGTM